MIRISMNSPIWIISELYDWLQKVDEFLSDKQKKIAAEILKEIRTRLKFLLDVGLDYLSLNRSSVSLSGGESQRIRLATQIGSAVSECALYSGRAEYRTSSAG